MSSVVGVLSLVVIMAAAVSACEGVPVEIAPAALVGCRAPDEPGCASCCGEGGVVYSASPLDQFTTVEPWYNVSGTGTGVTCTSSCASCSERSELQLRATAGECDCDGLTIGIDPCHSSGCACTCSIYRVARDACPAP